MDPRASEQNNSIFYLTEEKNFSLFLIIFISIEYQHYSEQDVTGQRSTIKELIKRSGIVLKCDDRR